MVEQKEYKLSDEVIARIAQCLQEAILLSVDVTDTLRMMRMCEDEDASGNLYLTSEYKKNIQTNYDRLLARAQKMKIETLVEDDA